LPVDVHATLKRAAQIQGRTLSDFVIGAAHEAALRAIEDVEIIRISAEDQKRFRGVARSAEAECGFAARL
jgi:uncharacterized protein (DUF1778 family)